VGEGKVRKLTIYHDTTDWRRRCGIWGVVSDMPESQAGLPVMSRKPFTPPVLKTPQAFVNHCTGETDTCFTTATYIVYGLPYMH